MVGVRFEVLRQVGETPLFTFYVAKDMTSSREVGLRVLKAPFAAEAEFVESLREVVSKVASVVHPRVEHLVELERAGETAYIVSEGPQGSLMSERLQKLASFSTAVSVANAIGVLEALDVLHRANIVHGQVSSKGIAIQPDGSVKLLAPGIWESFASSESAGAVMISQIAPYLAPEVGRGAMPTYRSDLYAVGALLYEMLCGRHPFSAESPISMVTKHITDAVPSIRMMNPSVPHVLDEIIKKAMAKDPEMRYSDASEMSKDLQTLQDALRFGKTLTWPLNATVTVSNYPKPAEFRNEEKPADPPMKRQPKKQEAVQYEPDVPLWLRTIIWLFSVVLIVMVGGWVFFNLNRPAEIRVPELKRLSASEARSRLNSLNLDLQIVSKEFSEDVPADHVLSTSPASGDKIYEGRSVQAVVSSGSKFVEVPDLRGFTLDKAKVAAASVSLSVGERVEEVSDRNVEAGLIVSQIPEPRIKVERFTPIRVKVSSGGSSATRKDPSDDVKYLYTITIRLTDISVPVNLRVDMTDSRGTKTVHESRREPGERVEVSAEGYGKKATFRLFYDGEMVKQVDKQADE